jgi:hypothetical protein
MGWKEKDTTKCIIEQSALNSCGGQTTVVVKLTCLDGL